MTALAKNHIDILGSTSFEGNSGLTTCKGFIVDDENNPILEWINTNYTIEIILFLNMIKDLFNKNLLHKVFNLISLLLLISYTPFLLFNNII